MDTNACIRPDLHLNRHQIDVHDQHKQYMYNSDRTFPGMEPSPWRHWPLELQKLLAVSIHLQTIHHQHVLGSTRISSVLAGRHLHGDGQTSLCRHQTRGGAFPGLGRTVHHQNRRGFRIFQPLSPLISRKSRLMAGCTPSQQALASVKIRHCCPAQAKRSCLLPPKIQHVAALLESKEAVLELKMALREFPRSLGDLVLQDQSSNPCGLEVSSQLPIKSWTAKLMPCGGWVPFSRASATAITPLLRTRPGGDRHRRPMGSRRKHRFLSGQRNIKVGGHEHKHTFRHQRDRARIHSR